MATEIAMALQAMNAKKMAPRKLTPDSASRTIERDSA
jgi:hypothetical protein